MKTSTIGGIVILAIFFTGGCAPAAYDIQVDIKNVSGEVKTNWPVILRVYTVFGRNLEPSLATDGIDVRDPSGQLVPRMIERIPPYDQSGNDEIVFVIPKIRPGEVLRYRITNTSGKSGKGTKIDLASSPHNLLANGGFEAAEGERPANFTAPARRDAKVRRSGGASLVLTADNQTVSTRYAGKIPLHKDSWYYFGAWSKTENVGRFGYQAGAAAHFKFTRHDAAKNKDVPAFGGGVTPQCSTRDWLKVTFESGTDDWGMDRYVARAAGDAAAVEFALQQRRHYYMEPGRTRGTWWLDDAVLMEQPEVNVRFDLALKPMMKDGVFVFTRPPSMLLGRLDEKKRGQREWCAMPYPHERLTALNKFALRGQRVSYCIGLYHTREVKDVLCRLVGGAVKTPDGKSLPVELIEFCPGYLGAGRQRYMKVLNSEKGVEPVTLAGDKGVRYFFLTFHVPADAARGKYVGAVELVLGGKDSARSIPISLRVQDMVQPTPKDVYVGLIYQGNNPRFDDEGMTVYSRSGFNCVTRFGNFFDYNKDEQGNWQIDVDKLDKRMKWLMSHGITAGVGVFSDFDLGPKWNGGTLLKRVRPADFNQGARAWSDRLKTAEKAWKAQIRRIEAARKAHPEWPELIYMTWDEPNVHGGRNGRPDPAMAWVNQVAPDALTTLDVQFDPMPVCMKWYRMPAFDDPANWAGPELYNWVKRQGKDFGYCGGADKDEAARYQPGMLMISTGARFFHAWHLTGGHIAGQVAYDKRTGKLLRAPAMINWGDGMNDLKAYYLLKDAIAAAKKDGKNPAAVKAAEEYLKKVFTVFNGDHKNRWSLQPYLGTASSWGYEGFYDAWQEWMAWHAAAVKGVKWVKSLSQ